MGRRIKIIVVPLIFVALLALYIFWDNRRITIVEQDVVIASLPAELEDYRILQISDLHEHEFGKGQSRLIKMINSIDYDAIVFTGDMLDSIGSTNYKSFYALIESIKNTENAYYVPGNTDPYNYKVEPKFTKSEFIKGMEDRGVQLLESIETIAVGDAELQFANFELSIIDNPLYIEETMDFTGKPKGAVIGEYLDHQQRLWNEVRNQLNQASEKDVLIALHHYPVPDIRIDSIQSNANYVWRNFDLIIAGHYHGGQIRFPLMGAAFIPEPWYDTGFFPPQDRVKGLWEYEGTKQYVSTGLGSSNAIPFLDFRLFNPPEINVLRLRPK